MLVATAVITGGHVSRDSFLTVSQFSVIGIFLFQLVSSRLSWGHGPGSQKGGSSGQFLSRDTLDRR